MDATERVDIGDGHVLVRHVATGNERGRVLLVPPFRLPASGLAPVGTALGFEGYDVTTFDPRDHVGDGSGTITDFRLSSFAEDCRLMLDRYRPTCVVAVSLGARAMLRALATADCPAAVLLTPVVDLRSTLRAVLGQDWFTVPHDDVPGLVPVLGVDIAAPRFLRDCEHGGFVDIDGTMRDLSTYLGSASPVASPAGRLTMIPGSHDPWVDVATVRRVVDGLDAGSERVTVRSVACDRHLFHEDPELALTLIGAVIEEVNAIHDAELRAR